MATSFCLCVALILILDLCCLMSVAASYTQLVQKGAVLPYKMHTGISKTYYETKDAKHLIHNIL